MWGAIIAGAAGAAGGYLKQDDINRKSDAAMAGAGTYKDGVARMYGGEQDELIRTLMARGASESAARAAVANSEMGRQLLERQSTGGAMGVRQAMMSGGEAKLAGQAGEAAGQEIVGSRAGAGVNLTQAQRDALARRAAQAEALRLYNEAKDAKKSRWAAAAEGFGNGLMSYVRAK